MRRTLVALLFTLATAIYCAAQVDPTAQINWPLVTITGSDTPMQSCASTNYGQPFQRTDVTPNKAGTCGADGWQYRGGSGLGTVTTTGSPASPKIAKFSGSTSITNAAAADVIALWAGCSGTQYLGADGTCHNNGGTGTMTSSGYTSGTPLAKFTSATNIAPAAASDVVNLFSGCSGTQYLGADGACHSAAGAGSPGSPLGAPQFYASSSTFGGNGQVLNVLAFSGATADVKIAAALAAACPVSGFNVVPVTNGTVDASGLTGAQTIATSITMPPNCTLILGSGQWERSTGAMIHMQSGSALIGSNQGLGFTMQRGTQLLGGFGSASGDTSYAIDCLGGTGGNGCVGTMIRDLSIYGEDTSSGIDFRHFSDSNVINVSINAISTGVLMGFPGGCDCYNSFYHVSIFAVNNAIDITQTNFANQNQFYGGRYTSSSGSAVYVGGDNNVFYSPDVENSVIGFEFPYGNDTVYAGYFEGNGTDVKFDSGSVGGAVYGGPSLGVTDSSGNNSNFVFTNGDVAHDGGNSPKLFATSILQLGGNLYSGTNIGAELDQVASLDSGMSINYGAGEIAVYGRTGGARVNLGPLYNAGASYLSALSVYQLPEPSPPTLAVVGTPGTTTLTYYSVCDAENFTTGAHYVSSTSSVATIANAPNTLNGSNYVTVNPNCGPGYTGAYLLKGATSGSVLLGPVSSAGPNTPFPDTGQSLTSFAGSTRNTTGDLSVTGYLGAAQYSVGANVVIPPAVTGNSIVNSGTKMVIAPSIPGAGAEVMTGPATSVSGNAVKFADTVGTLADAGFAPANGSLYCLLTSCVLGNGTTATTQTTSDTSTDVATDAFVHNAVTAAGGYSLGGTLSNSNITAGVGAGTGPSGLTITGTDANHVITLTTGSAPASSGTIVTTTFTASRGHTCYPVVGSSANPYLTFTQVPAVSMYSATGYQLIVGAAPLSSSTSYVWFISCP